MADLSHICTNIRSALVNNKIVIIPGEFVNKYALPSNEVNVKYIEDFAEVQKNFELKFAPKLSGESFSQNESFFDM